MRTLSLFLLGLLLTPRPLNALERPPDTPTADPSGYYRSNRGSAMGGDDSDSHKSSRQVDVEPERTGPVTLDDARGSFQTLVEAWLHTNKSADGSIRLKDPETGKALGLRYIRVDQTTLRELEKGRFTGDVFMRAGNGAKVVARATEDLSGNEWMITRFELPSRKQREAPKDISRLFGQAVMNYVRNEAAHNGAFFFDQGEGKKKRRLKLKMLTASDLKKEDATHYHSPVYFTDMDDQSSFTVEFFVAFSGDAGAVYKTEAP